MNEVIAVTGGGAGLGREIAKVLSRADRMVIVGDIDASAGAQTVEQIDASGGAADFHYLDVANASSVRSFFAYATSGSRRLVAAVNNAGISGPPAPIAIDEYPEEVWDHVVGVNFRGVWLCLREEVRQMRKRGGSIVNIASVAGLVGAPGRIAYYASKHGVIGLTRATAVECAPNNIRVNAVCPGPMRTAMVDALIADDPATEVRLAGLNPMGLIAAPADVAHAVAWLCSPEARVVTGIALPVDGGQTAT